MARPKKLSRQLIVDSALRRLDSSSVEELSMRGLAKELGVEAMSLYKHVGRRDELLRHLRRELFGGLVFPEPGGHPRRELEEVCSAVFRGLRRRRRAARLLLHDAGESDDAAASGWRSREADQDPKLLVWERMLAPLSVLIPEPLDRAYALRALYDFIVGQALVDEAQGSRTVLELGPAASAELPEVSRISEELTKCVPEVNFELCLRALLDAVEQRRGF